MTAAQTQTQQNPTQQQAKANIHERLQTLVGQGLSPNAAADKALNSTPIAILKAYVRPLVVDAASRYVRLETLQIEREVAAEIERGDDPVQARQKLLTESFWTPEHDWVEYKNSGLEHHEARVRHMELRAKGCQENAEFHKQIIADMRVSGVTKFRDLTRSTQRKHLSKAKEFAEQ